MLTTCPECHTTFRVTQEHLGLRRGLVRCGSCSVVFNGYDSLLAELVVPVAGEGGESPEVIALPAEMEPAPRAETPSSAPEPLALEEIASLDEPWTPPLPVETVESVEGAVSGPPAAEETSDEILLSELSTRVVKPPRSRAQRLRLGLQVFAALLLGAFLVLQLAYFLRGDLAAALPAARPLLEDLCQPLGCVVPLPRQLDKSAISASSLEHDAEAANRVHLSVLLSNRSGQTQTWPQLVLTLTDVRDAPVAQRVFSPAEYLPKGLKRAAGMATGTEREILLDLDTGTLAATGYALDLAYR
jgi:predicted Zn finger-like uncharacterized protein